MRQRWYLITWCLVEDHEVGTVVFLIQVYVLLYCFLRLRFFSSLRQILESTEVPEGVPYRMVGTPNLRSVSEARVDQEAYDGKTREH